MPAKRTGKKTPAWQRKAGKAKSGGLNAKGRRSYNKATGGNLRPPHRILSLKKVKLGRKVFVQG